MRRRLLASVSLMIASPVMAQTTATCGSGTPNFSASAGGFGVLSGQIYTPDGKPFSARGVDVMWGGDTPSAATLLSQFPGTNMIRLAIYKDGSGNYPSAASLTSYVNDMTSHGIVVELEDHTDSSGGNSGGAGGTAYTGSLLTQELSWYSSVASAFKTNPYVWFGTDNEPPNQGLSQWEEQTYDAIRGVGNNNPIMMELPGGGYQNYGLQQFGMDPSVYASMTNIIADPHFYGWDSNGSTNQATVNASLSALVQGAQTMVSADGVVPVIIGEVGNSTDGVHIDGNWQQVMQAVQQSNQIAGALTWAYGSGNPGGADGLVNTNGTLTSQGAAIAPWIAQSGSAGCVASPVVTQPTLGDSDTVTVSQTVTTDAATASGASGLTLDQIAAIAAQGGIASTTATPVLTVASPTGIMPTPAAVNTTTSFSASGNYQTVVPSAGNATGTVGGNGNSVSATGGIQTISVTGVGNTIMTGPYNDTITVSSAGNTIDTGGGTDTVVLTYGGGGSVQTNSDPAAVAPLAAVGNTFLAPSPGTGTLTIQGALASNDKIDLTRALAGTTWDHNQATIWKYVTASASATGCTISVGGQVIVSIPGGAPSGQLGSYVVAQ